MERDYLSIIFKILSWLMLLFILGVLGFCSYISKTPSTSWLKENFKKIESLILEAKDIICREPRDISITQSNVSLLEHELSENQIGRIRSILMAIDSYEINKTESCNISIDVHMFGFAGEGEFIYYSIGAKLDDYELVDSIEQPRNPENIPYYETRFKVYLKDDWYIRYVYRS